MHFEISCEVILNNNDFLILNYFQIIHFNIHIVKHENRNIYNID